jgi:Lar family restriction alleviation protein
MKPCPFCGCTMMFFSSVTVDDVDHSFVCCKECGCEGPYNPDETIARMMWNARFSSGIIYNFMRTKFVSLNGIASQSSHIYSEALEVEQSVLTPDIQHTAEEVMDCLHSCETALRILEEKYGINIAKTRRDVEQKNLNRGYYA